MLRQAMCVTGNAQAWPGTGLRGFSSSLARRADGFALEEFKLWAARVDSWAQKRFAISPARRGRQNAFWTIAIFDEMARSNSHSWRRGFNASSRHQPVEKLAHIVFTAMRSA